MVDEFPLSRERIDVAALLVHIVVFRQVFIGIDIPVSGTVLVVNLQHPGLPDREAGLTIGVQIAAAIRLQAYLVGFEHLVAGEVVVTRNIDEPILAEGLLPSEHHLVTVVLDLAHVYAGQHRGRKTLDHRYSLAGDENVIAFLGEIVEVERETVQEVDVETEVQLPRLLPLQVEIAQHRRRYIVAASQ